MPPKSLAVAVTSLLLLAGLAGCGTEATSTADDFGVTGISPEVLVPGSRLTLKGLGFPLPEQGSLTFQIEGEGEDALLKVGGTAEVLDSKTALCTLTPDFIGRLVDAKRPLAATLTVTRRLADTKRKDVATLEVELAAVASLVPEVAELTPDQFHLGDTLVLQGDGFLLPGEGTSILRLSGRFDAQSPPSTKVIDDIAIPLEVADRQHASFEVTPGSLSLFPGIFEGVATVVNVAGDQQETTSLPYPAVLTLKPVTLDGIEPLELSRGQYFRVSGSGFLPTDGARQTATVLELQGTLEALDGGTVSYVGPLAMVLFPDQFVSNGELVFVLRVTLDEGKHATGFGAIPGSFVGTATPVVYFGNDSLRGTGVPVELRIRRPLQVVFIKFLPSFDDAFEVFGLAPVAGLVKQRIVQRAQFFYEGVNIRFVDSRPDLYAEYSVIELAGEDPNGKGLLGLDNTTGKDTGNLRFDDVIGGKNAETEEQGYYAYGGVFLRSFMGFSPTVGTAAEALASPRFDDVFAPFSPELGGQPLTDEDLDSTSRQAQVDEAVRVLGNLVGSTVAHEVGHTLGLAWVPDYPNEFHNLGDNPGWLMDAGAARPFLERAELDGHGPEFLEENSLNYLKSILPMDN